MIEHSKFWDKISDKYAAMPIKDMPAYEQTLDRVRTHLSPGDHVLELGCGTGGTALILSEHVDRIVATDFAPNMVEHGRAKARAQGVENVDFQVAALGDDALIQGPFDVVLAMNLLHLVQDVPQAINDVHARLKPGGVFISKSGCLNETRPGVMRYGMRAMIGAMQLFGKAPYVNFFSIPALETMIVEGGFDIIETCTFSGAAPTQFLVARKR